MRIYRTIILYISALSSQNNSISNINIYLYKRQLIDTERTGIATMTNTFFDERLSLQKNYCILSRQHVFFFCIGKKRKRRKQSFVSLGKTKKSGGVFTLPHHIILLSESPYITLLAVPSLSSRRIRSDATWCGSGRCTHTNPACSPCSCMYRPN